MRPTSTSSSTNSTCEYICVRLARYTLSQPRRKNETHTSHAFFPVGPNSRAIETYTKRIKWLLMSSRRVSFKSTEFLFLFSAYVLCFKCCSSCCSDDTENSVADVWRGEGRAVGGARGHVRGQLQLRASHGAAGGARGASCPSTRQPIQTALGRGTYLLITIQFSLLQHLLDEQMGKKKALYLAQFGTEVHPLWPSVLEVSWRT